MTLPARGRQQVPVEFTVPTSRLLDVLERFRSGNWDNFSYRLAGHANWGNTPFGVPFERSGNLDILKRLSILFGSTLTPRGRWRNQIHSFSPAHAALATMRAPLAGNWSAGSSTTSATPR